MRTLLVSYDLGVPETSEDYKKLIEFIKTFPNWAKPLYAVWLVKTSKTCAQVRDEINQKIRCQRQDYRNRNYGSQVDYLEYRQGCNYMDAAKHVILIGRGKN